MRIEKVTNQVCEWRRGLRDWSSSSWWGSAATVAGCSHP